MGGLPGVEKDVARTDRDHPYFCGDHNPHVIALRDVLMSHAMHDLELGAI
jgi:hypothetical protein